MNENLLQVKSEITKVLRGKEDCIDQILCCMLAGGRKNNTCRCPLPCHVSSL